MAIADPLDHGNSEGFAQGAALPFLIEPSGNLRIRQTVGKLLDSVDQFGRIPYPIGKIG